jgi:hypothetical protein
LSNKFEITDKGSFYEYETLESIERELGIVLSFYHESMNINYFYLNAIFHFINETREKENIIPL